MSKSTDNKKAKRRAATRLEKWRFDDMFIRRGTSLVVTKEWEGKINSGCTTAFEYHKRLRNRPIIRMIASPQRVMNQILLDLAYRNENLGTPSTDQ